MTPHMDENRGYFEPAPDGDQVPGQLRAAVDAAAPRIPFSDDELLMFVVYVRDNNRPVYLNAMLAIFGGDGYQAVHESAPRGRKAKTGQNGQQS